MTKKLRFGMIGLGEIAYKSTGIALQQARNAEMVAGVDPVAHVAASYQATYGIPCFTNLDDLLGRADVDAVVLSVPHNLHAPLGIQAAAAGKHVVAEKPMATTLADADALIAACKRAGVLLTSKEGGSVLYDPANLKARELIAQGAIGDVMAVQIYGASNKPDSYWTGGYTNRVQTTWRKSKAESGGGILIMNYIYDIYRIRRIVGLDVVRVFAEYDTFRTPVEVEDYVTVSMRFTNGAIGTLTATSCAPGASKKGQRGTVARGNRVYGTQGQIVFNGKTLLVYTDNAVPGLEQGAWNELTFDYPEGRNTFTTYFERFADAVLTGGTPDVPGEEGRADLEIVLAAYKSGETHLPVALPLSPTD